MGIKPRRKRPPSVPAEAHWDKEEELWGAGAHDASGNKSGTWKYFWPDGEPAGTVSYDQDGVYHGPFHFVHPNGELWQSGAYVHGTRHGRFSYQRCSESSPGDAKHPLEISEEIVRLDMPHIDGSPQSYHMTLYNLAGAAAPLERDDNGRTVELGKGLDKLILDTTLLMTKDSALSVDGVRVERPDVDTRIVIKELGDKGRNILFRPAYGDVEVHVFSSEELSRAFALSSDYLLTDRDVRAAEDKAAADKLAARRELLRTISITNGQMSTYEFLQGMYADGHFPDFLVDKIKEILVRLCKEIEAEKPQDDAALLRLTHAATEEINGLEDEFDENDSELETGAREVMAADFDTIVGAYGFTDVDIEDVIATREW